MGTSRYALVVLALVLLVGCTNRAEVPEGLSLIGRCFDAVECDRVGNAPLGPCEVAGRATVCGTKTSEGVAVRVWQYSRSESRFRPIASTTTGEDGSYIFSGLPVAEYPNQLWISASWQEGYCEERVLSPTPFHRVLLNFYLCEQYSGPMTIYGNAPAVDRSKAGASTVIVPDPRTGEPTYHPY